MYSLVVHPRQDYQPTGFIGRQPNSGCPFDAMALSANLIVPISQCGWQKSEYFGQIIGFVTTLKSLLPNPSLQVQYGLEQR